MSGLNALIEQYKDRYESVYQFDIAGESFIFRPLTRKEHKDVIEREYPDDYSVDEYVCYLTVIYPEDYDFSSKGKAGIAGKLSEHILAHSGYANPNQRLQLLTYYRQQMEKFDSQAETCISLVFQGTTEEEMQEWTQEKFFRMLTKAEWVMKNLWNLPFEFTAKNETEEGEEAAPPPEPTLKELGEEIRAEGGDPMIVMKDQILKRPDEDFLPFPFIGGMDLLNNEELLDHVRKLLS